MATGAGTAAGSADENVQRLVALGFPPDEATAALQASGGSVERAAERLLEHDAVTATTAATTLDDADDSDADLQRALEASAIHPPHAAPRPGRTAAMARAAQAAEQRAVAANDRYKTKQKTTSAAAAASKKKTSSPSSTVPKKPAASTTRWNNNNGRDRVLTKSVAQLREHHPDMQLIPKLQDKSVEEQVLRCADRLKSHPAAVETLSRAVAALQRGHQKGIWIQTSTMVRAGHQGHTHGQDILTLPYVNYFFSQTNLLTLNSKNFSLNDA
jgi:hypothetical protein